MRRRLRGKVGLSVHQRNGRHGGVCDGVHVCSCVCHVSPTFSYRPERDKSRTPVKTDSDNIAFYSLYGTVSGACQGGDSEGWFREAGLSEPRKGMVRIEEVQEFTADPLQTVQYERDFLPILVTVAVILRVSPISPFSYSPDRLAAVQ
jgi:hypothetical protein